MELTNILIIIAPIFIVIVTFLIIYIINKYRDNSKNNPGGDGGDGGDGGGGRIPNCENKTCGDNGYGGSCGNCIGQEYCSNGNCTCNPSCKNKTCGDDGCGGSCGTCKEPEYCLNGMCIKTSSSCAPNCKDKECGNNGCGGQCGSCKDDEICIKGKCVKSKFNPCIGECDKQQCGQSNCGGHCNNCSLCGSCDVGNYCLNGTCIKSNCNLPSEIELRNGTCCDTKNNNYFGNNSKSEFSDSCCPINYNCNNGCSPIGWYPENESDMFCNIASETTHQSWPKNPRVCGEKDVVYPRCPETGIWAQSREGLSCEEIVYNNFGLTAFIESNGFRWNQEHSRCEPVDHRDNITTDVYPQLLDCIKANNNHNGICTESISNCDSCNGNMYSSCFCAPIIKVPIYKYERILPITDTDNTGETLNLPVITNQVKMDLNLAQPKSSLSPSKSSITVFNYILLTVPIGVWLNLDNDSKGIEKLYSYFDNLVFPSFIFYNKLSNNENIDIKLDVGYYKNVDTKTMTLSKTEFYLRIKLENGIINIYYSNATKPIISITDQQDEGYTSSPDYKILNASYRFNEGMLDMVLAFPNSSFSDSLSYIPTNPVTPTKPVTKVIRNTNIIRDTKNIINYFGSNEFLLTETTMIKLDPTKFPDII